MTTDPAALRAQSLCEEEQEAAVFQRAQQLVADGRSRHDATSQAIREGITAAEARGYELARARAEEAEKLAARLEKALRGEIWNAVNRRRQNLAAIGLPIHPAATQMLDETEVFVQAAINRALAGPAAPPPPSAEQQETLSEAPTAREPEPHVQVETEIEFLDLLSFCANPEVDTLLKIESEGGAEWTFDAREFLRLAQGNAADRPPPALSVEQNRPPDGASLDEHDRRTMEAWRSYFLELCDALFPESIGRPHLIGWKHVIKRARELVTGERARSAPPALPSAAASAEKQEGRPSGLILPNDEKHGAWCIFDGPQWGCDFCCEPEGRVIEALRSEARICSACVSLAGDLEPKERASPEAPTSTENTPETPK